MLAAQENMHGLHGTIDITFVGSFTISATFLRNNKICYLPCIFPIVPIASTRFFRLSSHVSFKKDSQQGSFSLIPSEKEKLLRDATSYHQVKTIIDHRGCVNGVVTNTPH